MLITVDSLKFDQRQLEPAADIIRRGGLVAFPTETVYGLGASVFGDVSQIFAAKGRPSDNPLIVHISAIEQAEDLAIDIPDSFYALAQRFWGGPLTLVLKKHRRVPYGVTGGLDSVALRLPSHPVAYSLIEQSQTPIAAPSANLSGKPSPTLASHVIEDLMGKVDCIIDGGPCLHGVESTVLDLTEQPCILRPGVITHEQLETVVKLGGKPSNPAKSPGTRYKHYAPAAKVTLVTAARACNESEGGIIIMNARQYTFKSKNVCDAGRDEREYAARLFYLLRELDQRQVKEIFAVPPARTGIGAAVYDRLERASQ